MCQHRPRPAAATVLLLVALVALAEFRCCNSESNNSTATGDEDAPHPGFRFLRARDGGLAEVGMSFLMYGTNSLGVELQRVLPVMAATLHVPLEAVVVTSVMSGVKAAARFHINLPDVYRTKRSTLLTLLVTVPQSRNGVHELLDAAISTGKLTLDLRMAGVHILGTGLPGEPLTDPSALLPTEVDADEEPVAPPSATGPRPPVAPSVPAAPQTTSKTPAAPFVEPSKSVPSTEAGSLDSESSATKSMLRLGSNRIRSYMWPMTIIGTLLFVLICVALSAIVRRRPAAALAAVRRPTSASK